MGDGLSFIFSAVIKIEHKALVSNLDIVSDCTPELDQVRYHGCHSKYDCAV